MKVAVFGNSKLRTRTIMRKLSEMLIKKGVILDNKNPDIVISVGGDGTILSAFQHYFNQIDRIRFIGVHTGHLGFYTDYRDFELEELVNSLSCDKGEDVAYPVIDLAIFKSNESKPVKYFHALNESTVRKVSSTFTCDLFIKGDFFERFKGDGLCISTPTGSTGYNKSLGGAVLHPTIKALQVTEIASLNNSIFRTLGSPMVISPHEWVEIKLVRPKDIVITADRLSIQSFGITKLKYMISKHSIHFVKYRHMHFWDRVENSFIHYKKS